MEFKNFLKAAALTAVVASSASVNANPNPYTECGIGALVFNNPDVIDDVPIAAVITNIIWDLGTTAVISATATPETCTGAAIETAMFINDSYDSLVEETARGEGEHLSAMLSMAGCATAEQSQAAALIRSDVADVVTAEGYQATTQLEKSSAYYDAMQRNVAATCVNSGV